MYQKNKKKVRNGVKIVLFGIIMILLNACRTLMPQPSENVHTVIRYVDSVRYINDTLTVELVKEVYKDYVSLKDTLRLKTKYAKSWAALDTFNMILVGEIENSDIPIKVEYKWKEHYIHNDSIVEIVKEVPYPVEVIKTKVPKWSWYTLAFTILVIGFVGIKVYLKFKPL